MRIRTAVCAAILLGSTSVRAQDDSGWLFGIGAGQSSYEIDALGFDDEATAWKVFGGWRINPNFNVELAYIDGGSVDATVGSVNASAEAEVIQGSVVGGWWFSETFGAYGRLGMNAWEVEASASGPGGSVDETDDGNDFGWGVGLQALWDNGLWRLEYESAEFDDTVDASLISLSLAWRF